MVRCIALCVCVCLFLEQALRPGLHSALFPVLSFITGSIFYGFQFIY